MEREVDLEMLTEADPDDPGLESEGHALQKAAELLSNEEANSFAMEYELHDGDLYPRTENEEDGTKLDVAFSEGLTDEQKEQHQQALAAAVAGEVATTEVRGLDGHTDTEETYVVSTYKKVGETTGGVPLIEIDSHLETRTIELKEPEPDEGGANDELGAEAAEPELIEPEPEQISGFFDTPFEIDVADGDFKDGEIGPYKSLSALSTVPISPAATEISVPLEYPRPQAETAAARTEVNPPARIEAAPTTVAATSFEPVPARPHANEHAATNVSERPAGALAVEVPAGQVIQLQRKPAAPELSVDTTYESAQLGDEEEPDQPQPTIASSVIAAPSSIALQPKTEIIPARINLETTDTQEKAAEPAPTESAPEPAPKSPGGIKRTESTPRTVLIEQPKSGSIASNTESVSNHNSEVKIAQLKQPAETSATGTMSISEHVTQPDRIQAAPIENPVSEVKIPEERPAAQRQTTSQPKLEASAPQSAEAMQTSSTEIVSVIAPETTVIQPEMKQPASISLPRAEVPDAQPAAEAPAPEQTMAKLDAPAHAKASLARPAAAAPERATSTEMTAVTPGPESAQTTSKSGETQVVEPALQETAVKEQKPLKLPTPKTTRTAPKNAPETLTAPPRPAITENSGLERPALVPAHDETLTAPGAPTDRASDDGDDIVVAFSPETRRAARRPLRRAGRAAA